MWSGLLHVITSGAKIQSTSITDVIQALSGCTVEPNHVFGSGHGLFKQGAFRPLLKTSSLHIHNKDTLCNGGNQTTSIWIKTQDMAPKQFHAAGPMRIRLGKGVNADSAFTAFKRVQQSNHEKGLFKYMAFTLYHCNPSIRSGRKHEIVLFVQGTQKYTVSKWAKLLGPGIKIVRCAHDKFRAQTIRECQGFYQDDTRPGEWLRAPLAIRSEEFGNTDHLQLQSVRVANVSASISTDDAPQFFKCPISFEIMTDPVITPSGHSYERSYLMHAICENPRGQPFYVHCVSSKLKLTN